MTDLNKLIEGLISDDHEKSDTARQNLFQLIEDKNKIFDALVNALNSGNAKARMEILNFLEFAPASGVEAAIKHILRVETDSEVKEQAIRTIKRRVYGTSELLALCDDDNDQVREEALSALNASYNLDDIVNIYEKALQDKNSEIQLTAAYALENIRESKQKFPAIKPLLKKIEKEAAETSFQEELTRLEYSMNAIFPDLEENSYGAPELWQLLSAIHELDQNGQYDAVASRLIEALNNDDPRIRLAAMTELTKIYPDVDLDEGEVIVDAFITMLSDPQAPIRNHAVEALFESGSTKMQDALTPLLEDADEVVRRNAKWVLSTI